jgi:hypothetical protein
MDVKKKEKRFVNLHGELFYDFIKYDPEFGSKTTIIFTIPWYDEWDRYDDIIDYYEYKGKDLEPITEVLTRPIYPHDFYIDNRNGNRIKFDDFDTFRFMESLIVKEPEAKDKYEKIILDHVKTMGFKTWEEAKKHIAPGIPFDIRLMCEYLGVFKNINDVYTLKPMIYTYWS